MKPRSDSIGPASLATHWRRWSAVVELFARRRPARRRVDPREYRALYCELTASCRDLASAGDEAGRAYYERLEATVRPWLSLRALEHADREVLGSLLDRCRQVDRELGGWSLPIYRVLALTVLLPSALVALSALTWNARGSLFTVVELMQDWSNVIWFATRRASDLEKLFALGLILISTSIIMISCTARS
jgi:hypothetical protein